jgi:hypothetical protein
MKNSNIPYLIRNKTPTLIVLSVTAVLMLLASPPVLSNFLLQPAQAQTAMNFKTPTPASGTLSDSPFLNATLTFDVHGTQLINSEKVNTKGIYTITTNHNGKIAGSGPIVQVRGCCLTINGSAGKPIQMIDDIIHITASISTSCSTSATNHIDITDIVGEKDVGHFQGPVECSPQGGNSTTNQQESSTSSMAAGSSQDGDGDGIPDSSDRCTHTSNPRCFKEGDTSSGTTTHDQQQPSSSSSSSGNQTTTTQERQQPSSNRTGNQTR